MLQPFAGSSSPSERGGGKSEDKRWFLFRNGGGGSQRRSCLATLLIIKRGEEERCPLGCGSGKKRVATSFTLGRCLRGREEEVEGRGRRRGRAVFHFFLGGCETWFVFSFPQEGEKEEKSHHYSMGKRVDHCMLFATSLDPREGRRRGEKRGSICLRLP